MVKHSISSHYMHFNKLEGILFFIYKRRPPPCTDWSSRYVVENPDITNWVVGNVLSIFDSDISKMSTFPVTRSANS